MLEIDNDQKENSGSENSRCFEYGCSDKCLYLKSAANETACARIQSWENGLAFERFTPEKGWHADNCDPDIPLLHMASALRACELRQIARKNSALFPKLSKRFPFEAFISQIPSNMRRIGAIFKWRQIPALQCFAKEPRSAQLAESNPSLFMLLIDKIAMRGLPGNFAAGISLRKRRAIIQWIFGLYDESGVRLCAKIRLNEYRRSDCNAIRLIVGRIECRKRFMHFKHIGESFIRTAGRNSDILRLPAAVDIAAKADSAANIKTIVPLVVKTERLLAGIRHYSRKCGISHSQHIINKCLTIRKLESEYERLKERHALQEDICAMLGRLDEPCEPALLHALSHSAIQHMHDRLVVKSNALKKEEYVARCRERYNSEYFPAPPAKGTARIIPVRCAGELFDEACEMQNCIASYLDKIMSGKCYIYSVRAAQRATLELAWTFGKYHIAQIRGRRNTQASHKTLALVNRWIDGINNGGYEPGYE